MKKIIRLTESELTRIVRRVISEQAKKLTPQDYKEIANYFKELMTGLNVTSDAANDIQQTIVNRINNKQDWEGVKKAFGVQDGQNLDQWLQNEYRIDYNMIMKLVNQKEGEFQKQNSMYNPGTVIRLITNRQMIIGRSYTYSSSMGNTRELFVDIEGAKVIRKDKDGIIIKAESINYYDVDSYNSDTEKSPQQKFLYNVCVKIPFDKIIQRKDDTLQINWFASRVKDSVVPCG